LREHLDHIPESPIPKDELHVDIPGPELLFGRYRHATKEEILAGLPPKSVTDNLLETFFESMDTHPSKLAGRLRITSTNYYSHVAQANLSQTGKNLVLYSI